MEREWMVLDAFNNTQGPYSQMEVLQLCLSHGDLLVIGPDMLHWQRASELPKLNPRATSRQDPSGERLDANGQPIQHRIGAARCADRDIQELLGLMKGILADGVVTDSEVVALAEWAGSHPWAHDQWPVNAVVDRLNLILADGVIEPKEREELKELLERATGERPDASTAMNGATRLPLDEPVPEIVFPDRIFVLTGKFAFGTRRRCEDAVVERGGRTAPGVTKRTDFLVIGTLASSQWALSSYGRKIEKGVALRESGTPLAIVAEEEWRRALQVPA